MVQVDTNAERVELSVSVCACDTKTHIRNGQHTLSIGLTVHIAMEELADTLLRYADLAGDSSASASDPAPCDVHLQQVCPPPSMGHSK